MYLLETVLFFLCMTFKTTSDDNDQVLQSTFSMEGNPYTEISISGAEKNIVITSKMGTTSIISVQNDVKQWSTLYVAYNGYDSNQLNTNILLCAMIQRRYLEVFYWISTIMDNMALPWVVGVIIQDF